MEKKLKIAGMVSANLVLLGTLAKLLEWPLASILLPTGVSGMVLWFIPAVAKAARQKNKVLFPLVLAGSVAAITSLGSSLFVVFHWPYHQIALLLGVFIPLLTALPLMVYYYAKTPLISLRQFVALIVVFLFLSVLDSFLSITYSREFVQESQFLRAQVELLNATYNELPGTRSPASLALRKAISEASLSMGNHRLTDSWPAEKVLWVDHYGDRLQQLLKAYNQEVAKSGFTFPDEFSATPKQTGNRIVPWCEYYFGSQETFIILDRLSRLELYVNQCDYKRTLKERELAGR